LRREAEANAGVESTARLGAGGDDMQGLMDEFLGDLDGDGAVAAIDDEEAVGIVFGVGEGGVEVVADHVDGDVGLVVGVVEEVFDHVEGALGEGQGQGGELHGGMDGVEAGDDGVVFGDVLLRVG